MRLPALVASLVLGLALTGAAAQDLVIGSSTEPSSIDPHFSRTGNNQQIAAHIFDRLVAQDENLQIRPALAESWRNTDPLTWQVRLRAGVRFSDGSPLTAEDVVYSLNRARNIPKSPAPFTGMVGSIASMRVVDARTIEFKTKTPQPQFMELAGLVYIVSAKASEGKGVEDFNKGGAAIGTGPYRFKQWVPGDRVVLERNETHWGPKPDFRNVTFKAITNDAARVAALRSGAVDLIDGVPPQDVASFTSQRGFKVFPVASSRLIYLALDSGRAASPFVTDASGAPLTPNPLKDVRVRQALSKMIDRQLIIDRLLNGAAEASGQQVPAGMGGHVPDLRPDTADVAAARRLLAEAGLPNGFGLTIHTSNDRFPGDAEVAQALGQMFARGGLKVNNVAALPYNVFAAAATRLEYSVFLFSIGNSTSSSGPSLQNVLMTYSREAGNGAFNRGRYSNPAFDAKLREAMSEFDPARSEALLQEATRMVFRDVGFVPLYWQKVYWAGKANIDYTPSKREDTAAMSARLVR